MQSKNIEEASVCGMRVRIDQSQINHPFLLGYDLNIHPGYIRKEDLRHFCGVH